MCELCGEAGPVRGYFLDHLSKFAEADGGCVGAKEVLQAPVLILMRRPPAGTWEVLLVKPNKGREMEERERATVTEGDQKLFKTHLKQQYCRT